MMRLAEIEAHIGSMAELLDIVGAMRSLAGMRRQEAQRALPGVRRYADAMAAAISDALLLMPLPASAGPVSTHRRQALVLYLAEHGFVGGFNERLIDAARQKLKPGDPLFIVGSRGAAHAVERGIVPSWTSTAATRTAAAVDTARRIASELYRRIARGEIDAVETAYAADRASEAPAIRWRRVWPVDIEPGGHSVRQDPLHNLRPAVLFEALISEYVFALLTEAAVESIATENASRFSTMEAAHDNIAKKLDELRQNARQARQAEITMELLDLVTGAEAQEASV